MIYDICICKDNPVAHIFDNTMMYPIGMILCNNFQNILPMI